MAAIRIGNKVGHLDEVSRKEVLEVVVEVALVALIFEMVVKTLSFSGSHLTTTIPRIILNTVKKKRQ